ncbi:MAG: PAS domain S-box protein [SAR324 cluster bacterium]|nr:PAS domain S-box protein [SAR324 cluster bacterium]MBL7034658.1 PAS domain S-box protein [SAR324 cluster bacterium]
MIKLPENSPEFFDTIDTLFLILSTAGKILLINRVCRETLGYSKKDAEGKSFLDLFFEPKAHKLINSLLEEATKPPFRTTYEDPWRTQNGGTRLISFTISSLRDSAAKTTNYTVTGLDITRFRKMEEELWDHRTSLEEQIRQRNTELVMSQARLSGILETAEDAIISVNADQQITMFNNGAEKIFGYCADEVLGKPLGLLMPEVYRASHSKHLQRFGESEQTSSRMSERSEIYGKRKNGTTFSAEANISQFEIEGEQIYTAILRDVTDRKIVENELRESLSEKEVLLKEIHHRVKNNLQVISSLFTLQLANTDDPDRLTLLRESQHRIQSMALIHEKIYQSESLAQIHFQQYVKDLVSEIFQSYQTVRGKVRLSFDMESVSLNINKAIPCALILNELTSNALKYAFTEQENGVFFVGLKLENKKQLILTVSDNGKGIPAEIKFSSAKTLGLRLVRVLTRQLKGQVELKQNPDCPESKGTYFVFCIPLE